MNMEFIIHFIREEISLMFETPTGTGGCIAKARLIILQLPVGKAFLISISKYFKSYFNGDKRTRESSPSPVSFS